MMDWDTIRRKCLQSDEILKIDKQDAPPLPPSFRESNLGFPKGAIRQYRDGRPSNSLHVHEFPDYFLVHVDTFNPEYHPVAHGVVDTPGITLAAIAGAVAVYLVSKAVRGMSVLPYEEKDA